MATVEELLRRGAEQLRAAGSESARLDAELLLANEIGIDRTAIVAHPTAPVGAGAAARYEAALARRAAGEPVAYIRGIKEFHGLAFAVDDRALIPRPETELLVDLALDDIVGRLTSAPRPTGTRPLSVADVGTGSGAIAVSVAVALRKSGASADVRLFATDVSPDALELARENAVGHGVADVMRFVEADLLPPVIPGPFDLVLANLPYIPTETLPELPVAASFEPGLALDGGLDGLDVVRALLARLPEALAPGGLALLEIGADQSDAALAAIAASLPGWPARVEPDLTGRPRVVRLERPAA
ncbi:MAG: peptide chain release factor N(5)-glutamine methyltransferase [Chloroflexi bacterium]|nr:peptide chain release factor N(5)-glutamine methyltransferase [Chloroflexota bacterium]